MLAATGKRMSRGRMGTEKDNRQQVPTTKSCVSTSIPCPLPLSCPPSYSEHHGKEEFSNSELHSDLGLNSSSTSFPSLRFFTYKLELIMLIYPVCQGGLHEMMYIKHMAHEGTKEVFYYHHWASHCPGNFLKTESLIQGIREKRIMGYGWSNIRKQISIRGPLEVLRSNDFPNLFTRCKMVGFVVNQIFDFFIINYFISSLSLISTTQTFELLSSVFKFL